MRIALLARERNNNFNLLRFLAASAVIFSHSYALTGRGLDEPLLRRSDGATYLGSSGVTVFFIISGFLVSKSFTERKTLAAFAAARALRIYPARDAATLFSAVVAVPLCTSPWAAAVALLVLVVNPGEILRGPFSLILLAYVVLTFALHPTLRFAAFNRIGDYSYGLYVYAFPIQQALVNVKHDLDPFGLFAAAFALTLLMAMASWHGMEKPALGL